MTTGLQSQNQDLDVLLMPRGSFTAIPPVHIESNGGVDISQRFAPVSAGSPYGTTGIQSVGVDIGTLFAAKSTNTLIAQSGSYSLLGKAIILVSTGTNSYTLVAGHFSPVFGVDEYGKLSTVGSVSPTTLNGYTISTLFTTIDRNTNQATDTFSISAPSDPGISLFSTLSVLGVGVRSSFDASYVYSSGTATWLWVDASIASGLFNSTGTYSVTIS